MKHIIHFTPDFDRLKRIVKSNFLQLHYCKEDFYIGDKKVSSAVHPMVSFSEYDVSTIDRENITYGKFGIGFSRTWIDKCKIHQVLYIDKNSIIANSLANLLIARRKKASEQLSPKVRLSIMTIKCFTKNAKGYNSHFGLPDFDFKNENEWRYVPTKKQIDGKLISQDKRKYLARQDFYNNQLVEYPLLFTTNDIECIFVGTQEQSNEIQRLISIDKRKIKISKWTT